MCGRYALAGDFSDFTREFSLEEEPGLPDRFNIAPSAYAGHEAPILTPQGLVFARFWYIPSFFQGPLSKLPTSFNARIESVSTKSFFRGARPCLVPSSGFREFPGERGHKRAVTFFLPRESKDSDDAPVRAGQFFAFAGIYSQWTEPTTKQEVLSFAILTTEPSPVVAPYHDRMPVIVPRSAYAEWRRPESDLKQLLTSAQATAHEAQLSAYESSTYGNSTRVEGPECIAPVTPQLSLF